MKKKNPSPEEQHPVRKAISDILKASDESVLLADGFEDALIGITSVSPGRPLLAVYDYDKCIRVLMKRDKMKCDEAVEFFEFNTIGAWVGPRTPIFMGSVRSILRDHGMENVLKKIKKKVKDTRQMELV